MAEAAKRLAGRRQQRVVVHRRQRYPLATLARQRVIDQDVERLLGRDPRQRQPKHHLPHRVEAPRRASEEPMEDRDVALPHPARCQRHCRDRPTPQTVHPPSHHQPKDPVARRMETWLERREQTDERAG